MPTIIFLPLFEFGHDSFQLTDLHHLISTASYILSSLKHNADQIAGADYFADADSGADADELWGRRDAYGAVQLTMPGVGSPRFLQNVSTEPPSPCILNFERRKFSFRLSFLRDICGI